MKLTSNRCACARITRGLRSIHTTTSPCLISRVPFGGGNALDQKMSKAVIHNNTIYLAGTTADDDVVDRQAGTALLIPTLLLSSPFSSHSSIHYHTTPSNHKHHAITIPIVPIMFSHSLFHFFSSSPLLFHFYSSS